MSKKPTELSKRKGHKANIVKFMNESEIVFLLFILLLVGLRFGDREWFLQLLLAGNPVTSPTTVSVSVPSLGRRYRFRSSSAAGGEEVFSNICQVLGIYITYVLVLVSPFWARPETCFLFRAMDLGHAGQSRAKLVLWVRFFIAF